VTLEALNFLASSFNIVCLSYLRAKQRSALVVGAGLASLVLSLSLNIYFIAVRHSGAVGVLYSGLISTVLATLPLGVYVLRQVKFSFSYKKLKDVVTFGAPLIITSIAAFTVNFSDRFFLRHYATISTVGVYALGYKFGFMISVLLVQPFDLIWQARIYQIAKQNPTGEIVRRVFEYYCFLLVFAALGLSLFIREFLTIVSAPSFHSAYKLVPVIALAYVFQGTNRFFLTGTYISKKTVYLGAVGLVNAATNIALNFLLIPRFGMLGAAWATACSFFFMSVLAWRVSQSVHRIPYVFSRVAMLLGLAAFLCLACNLIVFPSLLVQALFKFGVFALFPVALYLLGFFHKHELDKGKAIALEMMGRYRLIKAES
jgi:O-antigen/teichoic acid export membrane protein